MASDAASPKLTRYVVYMPNKSNAVTYPFYVSEDAEVAELLEQICDHRQYKKDLESEKVSLLKCDDMAKGTPDERFQRTMVWLRQNYDRARMDPSTELKEYLPNGPAPRQHKKIDIIIVTESILESPDVLYALLDKHAQHAITGRLSLIEIMRNFSSPSEGVKSEEKIKGWVKESSGVHPHRPSENYGPPTALFHPSLALLKDRLRHLDQVEEPSADYYRLSHEFITTSSRLYDGENIRQEALKHIINTLIGADASWQKHLQNNTAKPDAVWGREKTLAILELKNVDGVNGNATLQCLLDYAKVLAQPKYRSFVVRSNCPAILIGMMGNRLEISTAVFTNGIYTDQLLSEDFYIDAWQSETVVRVARIFKVLSLGIAELEEYYKTIHDDLDVEPTTTHLYPDPLSAAEESHIPQLNYIGKLSRTGNIMHEVNAKEEQKERPYALYRAKLIQEESGDEVDVVVKFTVRYHEKAHRMLADKQLAPTLHFCIPIIGDMYMVIMDYIESKPLSIVLKPQDPEAIYTDVKMAIDVLHKEDLVFGDLRVQNILCKPSGGAMLIDYDWVGEHELGRYPASWNNDNMRALGVYRMALMDKVHDIEMLEMLKEFLRLE